ncbi:MAG: DUF86 domain-containing protein [Actinomycetota bacterium]|nr:DUF86 domain-containing protein [Actinomycetota bacterium]
MTESLGEVEAFRPAEPEVLLDPAGLRDRRALERVLYMAIQDLLDVASYVLAEQGWRVPETYRAMIIDLGRHGVLPTEFAEKIAGMAGFRNVLEHEYRMLDTSLLYEYSTRREDFERFAGYILEYADRV